jgi:type III restriction enzyme
MIRETKSTPIDELLRPTEVAKIDCGKKHFAAIGIEDYAKSSPEEWRI